MRISTLVLSIPALIAMKMTDRYNWHAGTLNASFECQPYSEALGTKPPSLLSLLYTQDYRNALQIP